jgi:RNA polymerase sigma-54 factor
LALQPELTPTQTQTQTQTQHLSAEARQGVALLAMSAWELGEYVLDCVQSNPFLAEDEQLEPRHKLTESAEQHVYTSQLAPKPITRSNLPAGAGLGEQRRGYDMEGFVTEQPALAEHLLEHLDLECSAAADLSIGRFLIGSIDDNGYLRISTEEAARLLGAPLEQVEKVLAVLQACPPAGLAARSLAECLQLQLAARGANDGIASIIVCEYLSEVAAGHLKQIAAALSCPVAEVQQAVDLIRSLNPRPGLQFGRSRSASVWPEVEITRGEGGFVVRLLDFDIPRLRLNDGYLALLDRDTLQPKTNAWLQARLKEAKGLIAGIEQRRQTIYRIACCLAETQSDFLEHGVDHLRPLTMAQVARLLELSESTVSRVVNGTYMQTPRGLLEMRYFFRSGVDNRTGRPGSGHSAEAAGTPAQVLELGTDTVSSESIKQRIKALVEAENPHSPLSDQTICTILAQDDIHLSRRTVTKYRQSLQIPSTTQRRRYQ